MRRITNPTSHGKQPLSLERLWDQLLSGQPELVRRAYDTLDTPDQEKILDHLQRMAREEGWQLEQRQSAQAALQALEDRPNPGGK
ncbi:MAG: hypothetical protein ACM3H7_08230 [Acidobacteriaceae bacterium]